VRCGVYPAEAPRMAHGHGHLVEERSNPNL